MLQNSGFDDVSHNSGCPEMFLGIKMLPKTKTYFGQE